MMQRIIATLFSLASLLERSTYAPWPICWFLVRLLSPVERRIRNFVLWTGWEAGAIAFFLPDPPTQGDDCRIRALDLAACFRAFAAALESLPKQLYERWRNCAALQVALRRLTSRLGLFTRSVGLPSVGSTPNRLDTS